MISSLPIEPLLLFWATVAAHTACAKLWGDSSVKGVIVPDINATAEGEAVAVAVPFDEAVLRISAPTVPVAVDVPLDAPSAKRTAKIIAVPVAVAVPETDPSIIARADHVAFAVDVPLDVLSKKAMASKSEDAVDVAETDELMPSPPASVANAVASPSVPRNEVIAPDF